MTGTFVLDENGNVAGNCFQIGDSPPREPQRGPSAQVEPAVPTARRSASNQQSAKPAEQTISAGHLVKQLRARLRVVEREIKAREKLEQERSQIKRLIAAATIERDNVRRLRSAG